MRQQWKSEVKFIPEKFAGSAESSSRGSVARSPPDVATGDDGALPGSSFLSGVMGRSQAALQEGKVEALRVTAIPGGSAKGTQGQAYTFAHCRAPGASNRKISSLSFIVTEDS